MQVSNRLIGNGIELPVAQLQSLGFGRLECLPYPTQAQELKDMPDEKQNPVTEMNEALEQRGSALCPSRLWEKTICRRRCETN